MAEEEVEFFKEKESTTSSSAPTSNRHPIATTRLEVDKFNGSNNFANLDVQIPDEDKALCLLNSLPDDYDHLTTTLLYGKSEVKLDEVSTALVNHECRKKEQKTQNSQTEALVARGRTEERKSGKRGKSRSKSRGKFPAKDECAFCRQKGHWKKDCPKLKNKEKEKAGSKQILQNLEVRISSLLWLVHLVDDHSKDDVRYVPDMKKNLISLGALESKGLKITMEGGVLKAVHGALVVMKALQGLVKQGLLKGAKACKLEFCEHCVLGKQTRVKFGTAIHHTKGILDYVHTDVWGPSKNASWGGSHYFVSFVDDFSRRIWVYTMKRKDEVLKIFLKWKKMIETQSGRKIKTLRSDNGGEYKSDPFLKVCQDEGIVRHFTVRETPQQNGVAERMNRTLLEKV
ncbi:unnamed protein product, partial [Prunus brigantina]